MIYKEIIEQGCKYRIIHWVIVLMVMAVVVLYFA